MTRHVHHASRGRTTAVKPIAQRIEDFARALESEGWPTEAAYRRAKDAYCAREYQTRADPHATGHVSRAWEKERIEDESTRRFE